MAYGLISVPRKYASDRVLRLVIKIVGNTVPTRWPLRWLMFRDLTAREQMEFQDEQEK